jgi:N-acyl homoserine lactone hydrolase
MTQVNVTPQRLYLMQLSTTTLPAAGRSIEMVSGCYLVRMSDGKNVLIDSGLPADYVPPTGTPKAENVRNVLEHLADLDLGPDDINMLICTHFDVDTRVITMRFGRRN